MFGIFKRKKSAPKVRRIQRKRMRLGENMLTRFGFDAAKSSNLYEGLDLTPTPINVELANYRRALVARARQLAKNDPYIRRYLHLCRINIVGPTGFRLRSHATGAGGKKSKTISDAIESAFKEWSKKGVCCAQNRYSLREIEEMCVDSWKRDGEYLVQEVWDKKVNRFGYALRYIDTETLDPGRIKKYRGNRVSMGVEMDSIGAVVAYHLMSDDMTTHGYYEFGSGGRVRVPADRMIHGFRTDFPNQSRGITFLTPTILRLRMLNGYEEAELVAARVGAAKMGFVIPNDEGDDINLNETFVTDEDDDSTVVIDEQVEETFPSDPGMLMRLAKGADVKTFDPNHPNSNYASYIKTVLRSISSGLGISYNTLASDLENVNYGSLRGGSIEDRESWKCDQESFKETLLDRVVENFIRSSLMKQAIYESGRPLNALYVDSYLPHYLQGRRWPWHDPLKDAQEATTRTNARMRSVSSYIREAGDDPDEVFEEIAEEQEKLKELGISAVGTLPNVPQEKPQEEDDDDSSDSDTEASSEGSEAA